MRKSMIGKGALALLLGLAMSGCRSMAAEGRGAAEPSVRNGHLVIVGGAFKRDNAALYNTILDLGGGRDAAKVAVLPTASGEPEKSGPSYAEDFDKYAGRPGASTVVDITTAKPEAAYLPENAEAIRKAGVVFFTGGVQERILSVLRPGGISTPADLAVREVLAKGGVVAGSSAGAAMMSDPMIRWGNSADALLVGASCAAEDRAVCLTDGMGFFPYGLTGQHFIRRGRLGRLVVALDAAGLDFGYGVDENKALIADLSTGRLTFSGTQAVLFVDMREATTDGLSRSGIRLSLLGGGDAIDGPTGAISTGPEKQPAARPAAAARRTPMVPDAWDDWAFSKLIGSMVAEGAGAGIAKAGLFDIRLTADGRTSFHTDPADPENIAAVNLRMDIVALDGAQEAAAALKQELGITP